jgi:site-specific recombinase
MDDLIVINNAWREINVHDNELLSPSFPTFKDNKEIFATLLSNECETTTFQLDISYVLQ